MRLTKTLFLVGVALLLLGGCAACNDCGSLKKKHEVTKIFTSSSVIPEYNYFYNGEIRVPRAIIGIDKNLTVEGTFWTPIDLTEEQLSRWVAEINRRPGNVSTTGINGRFQGFEILDTAQSRVGIWYSNYDWGVFKFPEKNKIIVYAPSFKPNSGPPSARFSQ